MRHHIFALMIAGVIITAGLTVALLTAAGPTALLAALPLFIAATVALKMLRK
jgi:hypothetical protein